MVYYLTNYGFKNKICDNKSLFFKFTFLNEIFYGEYISSLEHCTIAYSSFFFSFLHYLLKIVPRKCHPIRKAIARKVNCIKFCNDDFDWRIKC